MGPCASGAMERKGTVAGITGEAVPLGFSSRNIKLG